MSYSRNGVSIKILEIMNLRINTETREGVIKLILDQVNYINKGLQSEILTKVCESIGIDRITVRKRFKNKGDELADKEYIQCDKIVPTIDNTINTKPTANKKTIDKKQDLSNTKKYRKENQKYRIKYTSY